MLNAHKQLPTQINKRNRKCYAKFKVSNKNTRATFEYTLIVNIYRMVVTRLIIEMQIDMNERNRQSFYILEWACSQGVRFKYSVIFNLLTGLRSNFEFLLAFQSQHHQSYVVTLYLFQIYFFTLLSIIVPLYCTCINILYKFQIIYKGWTLCDPPLFIRG